MLGYERGYILSWPLVLLSNSLGMKTFAIYRTFLEVMTLGITVAVFLLLIASSAHAQTLTRELEFGMTGSDVSELQAHLAADKTIYPQGLITGYFGPLTKAAVMNFQTKYGISPVGRVGPITLAALNSQMAISETAEGAGKVTYYDRAQPVLSAPVVTKGMKSATIQWASSMPASAKVMYSTTWPFMYRTAASTTNPLLATGQTVTLSNLQSGTTYYYTVESLDPQGNFSWSTNGVAFTTD